MHTLEEYSPHFLLPLALLAISPCCFLKPVIIGAIDLGSGAQCEVQSLPSSVRASGVMILYPSHLWASPCRRVGCDQTVSALPAQLSWAL